jgi:hypothetical protein
VISDAAEAVREFLIESWARLTAARQESLEQPNE